MALLAGLALLDKHAIETPLRILRRETRTWHDRVEQAFAHFDLSTASGVSVFLLAQAAAVLPLEQALASGGIEQSVPDWSRRRRGSVLLDDLTARQLTPIEEQPRPFLPTIGQRLGALYVLEGSRLGGKVLARQIAGHHGGIAPRFLLQEPGPGSWPALTRLIDGAQAPVDEMISGAVTSFALFHSAAEGVARSCSYPGTVLPITSWS